MIAWVSLLIGFVIWTIAFGALYTIQALGCSWGWDPLLHRLVMVGAWIASIAVLGLVLLLQLGKPDRTAMDQASIWATLASIGATVVVFAPALFVSACI